VNYKKSLRKNIVWLLAIKLLALVLMHQLFFGAKHRVGVNAEQVENKFFASQIMYGEK
jgi:hypothetical protein